MAQLRQDYRKFVEGGAEVVVVGPEGREAFAQYWREQELPFVGLPDPQHTVLKLYGQQVDLFKLGRMPAQVLIDRNGRARFIHYGHSMSDIPPDERLLDLLADLAKEGRAAQGSA